MLSVWPSTLLTACDFLRDQGETERSWKGDGVQQTNQSISGMRSHISHSAANEEEDTRCIWVIGRGEAACSPTPWSRLPPWPDSDNNASIRQSLLFWSGCDVARSRENLPSWNSKPSILPVHSPTVCLPDEYVTRKTLSGGSLVFLLGSVWL